MGRCVPARDVWALQTRSERGLAVVFMVAGLASCIRLPQPTSSLVLASTRRVFRSRCNAWPYAASCRRNSGGSVSRLSAADGAERAHVGHRPSRGHTLRVRKVRHGNEAHRQGRSVAGSQPGALKLLYARGSEEVWRLACWLGMARGPHRAHGCFTLLQSRLSAVEFLDGLRPCGRFRRCCDISWLSAAELRS
jgi:hypothetical protein